MYKLFIISYFFLKKLIHGKRRYMNNKKMRRMHWNALLSYTNSTCRNGTYTYYDWTNKNIKFNLLRKFGLLCYTILHLKYFSPESVKTRNDVFYLLPERSCVPDSPVWYSTSPLAKEQLIKMLYRIKMVKEINVALLTS